MSHSKVFICAPYVLVNYILRCLYVRLMYLLTTNFSDKRVFRTPSKSVYPGDVAEVVCDAEKGADVKLYRPYGTSLPITDVSPPVYFINHNNIVIVSKLINLI